MPYAPPPGFRLLRVVAVSDPDLYRDTANDEVPPVGSQVALAVAETPDPERTAKRDKPFYAYRVAWLNPDNTEARAFIRAYVTAEQIAKETPIVAKRRVWPWVVAALGLLWWWSKE